MRTTLDVDDDVLLAVKELARARGVSAGRALSDLARAGLGAASRFPAGEVDDVLGFAPIRSRGGVVTDQVVEQIREAEGI